MMKKTMMLVTALVFGCSLMAQAQVKFGAKAGLNVASMTDASSKLGFYLGATAEMKLIGSIDKLAFAPELVYSMQGAEESGIWVRTHYINLPLMAKYYITDKFSLSAGPQLGFYLSGTIGDDSNSASIPSEFVKTFELGLGIGAAYSVWKNWDVEVRYNQGLTAAVEALGEKAKNSVFQLGAVYKF